MKISGDKITESRVCPLCNRDNNCAISKGEKPESCWCMTISISSDLLEKTAEKNRCICHKCMLSKNN